MIPNKKLNKWRDLADKATEGPWRMENDQLDGYIVSDNSRIFGGEKCEGYISEDDPDAQFVIAAREAVPALIADVKRLREERNHIKRLLETTLILSLKDAAELVQECLDRLEDTK